MTLKEKQIFNYQVSTFKLIEEACVNVGQPQIETVRAKRHLVVLVTDLEKELIFPLYVSISYH